MQGYNHLFGREMVQPLMHTADPTPFFWAHKCFICCFLPSWTIESKKMLTFV